MQIDITTALIQTMWQWVRVEENALGFELNYGAEETISMHSGPVLKTGALWSNDA